MLGHQNPETLAVSGATIVDGNGGTPVSDGVIVIEKGRIAAIGDRSTTVPAHGRVIDGTGKYVIPGLMDANVHLYWAMSVERLARHMGHYEDIIAEAAQVALRGGLTTVFDTWGPRKPLIAVREQINAGTIPGSRFFCAGNIVGFDGPFSLDFYPKAGEVAGTTFADRINGIWVENVGRHLMWLAPEDVAREVRAYVSRGIDFVKYASNEHTPGAFLAFSPKVQAAIVEVAHNAGITAQAHTTSIEGLRIAIEAGCDLIQHANTTGPVPIPESTLDQMARKKTGAVVFPLTQRRFDWLNQNADANSQCMNASKNINARNLIRHGVPLLMAWDAIVWPPELATDPKAGKFYSGEDNPGKLGEGHIFWFKAMEEMECPPMAMLQAATKNIAVAYKKDKDLGTLEKGKIADMLILDKDPLRAAENYRTIHMVIKNGTIVDRDALPVNPILTKPVEPPAEEEDFYVPFLSKRND
jgi:imidazolonepropionase-like amidohydrolase